MNTYDQDFMEDGSVNPQRKVKTQTNNLETFARRDMDTMIERDRASGDKDEMVDLSHRMTELHYEEASWVPGFYQGFFRVGHWRWVRYPDFFTHKMASGAGELYVHWIDTDMKEETLAARKSGQSFGPEINVYDQWK